MPLFSTPTWKAIEYAGDTGLNDYPIFDENYREYLNQRILEHYDEQEIGDENPIKWVFSLRRKMFEIMPRYNKLYLTERLVIDPTQSINLKTVFDGMSNTNATNIASRDSVTDSINNGESQGTSTQVNKTDSVTKNRARNTNSVMPQVRLSGNKDYATSGTDVVSGVDSDVNVNDTATNSGTSKDTGKATSKDDATSNTKANDTSHTENVVTGHDRPIGEIIAQYRTTFLNIEEMIIEDLGELFMLLWNTSDNY